jgi:hypothetical protein
MTSSRNALDEEEEWVLVNTQNDCQGFRVNNFWQGCKNSRKLVVKYYERGKMLYNVYRVVRFIVNMYILYHTLHPLGVF